MRKLIVCNIMSLDGHYTRPGNNVMVLPMDEAFDTYNAERLRAADTLLLGRTTYEGFVDVAQAPGQTAPVPKAPLLLTIPRQMGKSDAAWTHVPIQLRLSRSSMLPLIHWSSP